jgi:predicted acetyltransferase
MPGPTIRPGTAPHLAQRELVYVTPERTEEFFAAVLRGFHDEYVAEAWEPMRKVFEPERSFGFQVDGRWISTCGAYSRTMTVPGGSVPVAAVTVVTVQPSYRRRGLLTEMMKHQLHDIRQRGNEPIALLWASEAAIYGRYGYGQASPRLHLFGKTKTTAFGPDVDLGTGSVGEVERDQAIPVIKQLHQRLLSDRVGALNRDDNWWVVRWHDPEGWRHGRSAYRFALHYDRRGRPDGYVAFRVKMNSSESDSRGAEVIIEELDAANAASRAALWRFVLDLDLVRRFTMNGAPPDEPLRYLVADLRSVKAELTDGTYARLVDVPRALEARRYLSELDVIIGVGDPLLTNNAGSIRLQAGSDGASVSRSRRKPDLIMNVRELSAIYLGGTPLAALVRAGLVTERTKGAAIATAAAFGWPQPPFCPDFF